MRKYHGQGIYAYICKLSHSLILLMSCRQNRQRGRQAVHDEWTTNEYGWMTNLSFKKRRACVNIRMITNKMKAEDNIKNKTSQNKQKRPLTPQQVGIAAKPRDNSEMSENAKVSNSTVLLRYISSLAFFYWFIQVSDLLKLEVKLKCYF